MKGILLAFLLMLGQYIPSGNHGVTGGAAPFGCPSGSGSCYDTFTGTASTALATYNSNWVTMISPYDITNFQLGGSNTLRGAAGGSFAGAIYSPSTSTVSQIVLKPVTGASTRSINTNMVTTVDRGYGSEVNYSGGSYVSIGLRKSGTGLVTIPINTPYAANVDHIITLRARGTTPKYLETFIDGNIIATYVDASSTLNTGSPGTTLVGGGVQADTYFGKWCDYFCDLTTGQPLYSSIGSCTASTVLGTTVTCTLTAQGGEVLIIGYAWDDTTHTVSSIVDSSGDAVTNVYTPLSITHPLAWNGGSASWDLYTVKNATAGSHTITITMSGTTVVKELGIISYTGASTTAPIVTASTPIAISSITNPFSCNSLTTTSTQSIVAAFGGLSTGTRSAGANFFMRQSVDGARYIWEDQVIPTASTVTPTIASATTGSAGFCAAVAIK